MKSPTIIYSTPTLWDLIPNKEMKINSTGEEIVQIKYGDLGMRMKVVILI